LITEEKAKGKCGWSLSQKANANGKKAYRKISGWTTAFRAARKALGVKGFCPCGGKTAKGKALLAKTRALYKK